jgi:hypothetical protein
MSHGGLGKRGQYPFRTKGLPNQRGDFPTPCKPDFFLPNLPVHVVQRGNNRLVVFSDDDDRRLWDKRGQYPSLGIRQSCTPTRLTTIERGRVVRIMGRFPTADVCMLEVGIAQITG